MKNLIKIDPNITYQKFESIGASGAWWAQIVGGWDHIDSESGKSVRDRISELLYSKENGIGMRVYRYNLGGGSKNSGKGTFWQTARAAESFDDGATDYNWKRDKKAVYMMKQAVKDGADEVIFFSNSPPERLTKNGMSHCTTPFRENLAQENYRAFAKYSLDVTEHFLSEGLPIKYLSPINEPLWVWTGGQEGCHYRPASVRKVFDIFAEELEKRPALKGLKLSGAENGDVRGFNKSYTRQLLNAKKALPYLDAVDFHSYNVREFQHDKLNRLAFIKRLRKWMDKNYPDMPLKMSEWTHMKGGRDKGMDSALEMAKIMYEDISILNVVSWQHWIAVSEVDYCDGLIYINLEDKSFETTKRLYATGNFSKFIQYGAQRIAAECEDKDLQVLAFDKEGERVIILINQSNNEKCLSIDDISLKGAKLYVTDDTHDLSSSTLDSDELKISPRSVNTLQII